MRHCRSIVKDRYIEIQLLRQRGNGARDVPRTSDPEIAWWRNGFFVDPALVFVFLDPINLEIFRDTPVQNFFAPGKLAPDGSGFMCVWQNHPGDFAAADQTIIPAKIVIEQQIENFRFAADQRVTRAATDLRFQTSSTQSPDDSAGRKK